MENVEEQKVKSKKDSFLERLKGKYPDMPFTDDEELYGRINDDYDELENGISGYKKREEELSNMFASDPRSASFLTSWRKGGDPTIELVRQFGSEIKDALDDPEKMEAIAEANKEYVERVSKSKELDEQYEKNLSQSLSDLEAYQKERGLSDEDIDKGMEILSSIASDFILGKITSETLEMVFAALNHDADVEQAAIEAETRGKNSKIEEKLRKEKPQSGMPANLSGKNNSPKVPQKKKDLGVLDRYDDNNANIYERGGEKRYSR